MFLMSASRRWLAVLLILVLAIPALAMPFARRQTVSEAENRVLAVAPGWPQTFADWRAMPRAIDAFVADHFGFRKVLMKTSLKVAARLGATGERRFTAEGVDGRLFLVEGLLRATGQDIDPAGAERYASFLCAAKARLAAKGVGMTFAIAPSQAAVYPQRAPAWALPAKSPSQYDLVRRAAKACGVASVDLRQAVRAAEIGGEPYRRTDSHWTQRGALAAYNTLALAMGHAEWRIGDKAAGWFTRVEHDGDLARLAGREAMAETVEVTALVNLPQGAEKRLVAGLEGQRPGAPAFEIDTDRPGPTILVIGDSYTQHSIAPFLAHGAGRVVWAHHQDCGFDWRVVALAQPDQVLIMPVDRYAACAPGVTPKHFDD